MRYTGRHVRHWFIRRHPDIFDTAYRLTFRWERNLKGWVVLIGLSALSALVMALACLGAFVLTKGIWS